VVSLGFLDVDGGYSQHNSDKVEWAQTSSLIAACHSIIADALSRVLLLMVRRNAMRPGRRGRAGAKLGRRQPANTPSQILQNFPNCALQQMCAHNPHSWSLGASFESSLRAIRRTRPIARKTRRRLTALAGATDRRITGSTTAINHQARATLTVGSLSSSAPGNMTRVRAKTKSKTTETAACSLCLANSTINT